MSTKIDDGRQPETRWCQARWNAVLASVARGPAKNLPKIGARCVREEGHDGDHLFARNEPTDDGGHIDAHYKQSPRERLNANGRGVVELLSDLDCNVRDHAGGIRAVTESPDHPEANDLEVAWQIVKSLVRTGVDWFEAQNAADACDVDMLAVEEERDRQLAKERAMSPDELRAQFQDEASAIARLDLTRRIAERRLALANASKRAEDLHEQIVVACGALAKIDRDANERWRAAQERMRKEYNNG